jgi:hypothetical protein
VNLMEYFKGGASYKSLGTSELRQSIPYDIVRKNSSYLPPET